MPPAEDRATAMGSKQKNIGEDWMCSSGDMIADGIQTNTQTDRETDRQTRWQQHPAPQRGRSNYCKRPKKRSRSPDDLTIETSWSFAAPLDEDVDLRLPNLLSSSCIPPPLSFLLPSQFLRSIFSIPSSFSPFSSSAVRPSVPIFSPFHILERVGRV